MRTKFAALILAGIVLAAGVSSIYAHEQWQQQSDANSEKIAALKEAYRTGLISQQEYDAKMRELNGAGGQQAPSASGGSQTPNVPVTMRMARFPDPNLRMDFARLPVPTDWNFQGGLMQWTSCSHVVTEFYRATSPDGLSGVKDLPRFDYAWSDDGSYQTGPRSDCMSTRGPISAKDYLSYMIGQLNLTRIQDLDDAPSGGNGGRGGGRGNRNSGTARAITEFKINGLVERQLVSILIGCTDWPATRGMRGMFNHSCIVRVTLIWAPFGKLFDVFKMMNEKMNLEYNPAWTQLRAAMTNQQTQALVGQIVANGEAFRGEQDVRFQQHEGYMAAQQRGSDMNLDRFKHDQNAKQQMADDECDAILGQQKRYDPTTRQFYKTDSEYTYDWVNAEGKHYLTKDINDNPNGRGDGYYTLTMNVR